MSLTFITDTRKEGNVLFNDALSAFYLQLYGIRTDTKIYFNLLYLTTHSTHVADDDRSQDNHT